MKHFSPIAFIIMMLYIARTYSTNFRKLYNQIETEAESSEEKPLIDKATLFVCLKFFNSICYIIAILMVLNIIGINISALLAFGGIGGIAIGFAAKDFLSNMLGAFGIYIDKTFQIGDWIRANDGSFEGSVEDITWRFTKIRQFNQRPIYIPNALFSNIIIENTSRMNSRMLSETIGIRYDDINKVSEISEQIQCFIEQHPLIKEQINDNQPCFAKLKGFNDFSVDIYIHAYLPNEGYQNYFTEKQEILLQIQKIIESKGAEIAFPTQINYLKKIPAEPETHESSLHS